MRCTVAALLFAAALPAQGVVLDVFDGETLYDGGLLLTLGQEIERRDVLKAGSHRANDPLHQEEQFLRTTLALQYGLRHDLQLGVALPWVRNERRSDAGDLVGEGIGDIGLLAKYRFLRLDGPGFATNFAVLGGLSLPTGDDDQQDGGAELEPDLQPGSGGFDPSLGVAVTHEPGRWRFNAAARYALHTDSDGDGEQLGDEFVAELAAGNRFWLEPYPGPFMRLDLVARFHWHGQDRMDGPLPDSGGERWTAGVNWAFRPRPELDFQVYVELPLYEHLHGTQLGGGWLLDLTFGCRF